MRKKFRKNIFFFSFLLINILSDCRINDSGFSFLRLGIYCFSSTFSYFCRFLSYLNFIIVKIIIQDKKGFLTNRKDVKECKLLINCKINIFFELKWNVHKLSCVHVLLFDESEAFKVWIDFLIDTIHFFLSKICHRILHSSLCIQTSKTHLINSKTQEIQQFKRIK